jgi:hypothetical protein
MMALPALSGRVVAEAERLGQRAGGGDEGVDVRDVVEIDDGAEVARGAEFGVGVSLEVNMTRSPRRPTVSQRRSSASEEQSAPKPSRRGS